MASGREHPALHIVSFDIPYPPDYGGAIDLFYTIKSLHRVGVDVILHCFLYHRPPAKALEELCREVHYYHRKTGLTANLSFLPYIVLSRKAPLLIDRLLADGYPVLFEGLHSCYYIDDSRLNNRLLLFRAANIEHRYYLHLFLWQRNIFKRLYYLVESVRLRFFQSKLRFADKIFAISSTDQSYFAKTLPATEVELLPAFHADDSVVSRPGRGEYVLYHGNLAVEENENAALYLIRHVFSHISFRLIVAGHAPSSRLKKMVSRYPNVQLVASPDDSAMQSLIENAHINLLITFQPTGLKLKLLNALYKGRFCVVNRMMLHGSGLDDLCTIADSADAMADAVEALFNQEFTQAHIRQREEGFPSRYSNLQNAELLRHYLQTDWRTDKLSAFV